MAESKTSHTEKELCKSLSEDTVKGKLSSLYKKGYIKYTGKTKGKYYYDIIAEYLFKQEDLFNETNIRKIERGYPYKSKDHKPLTDKERASVNKQKRGEEWFARGLLCSKFEHIGEIIDYQIPIKASKKDKEVGKVDLLSYNKDENILCLIELKREYNTETILRAILEICTYYYQIDREKLKTEFGYPSATIQKAVLVFKDSSQHQEYRNSKPIKQLIEKLDVKVFVLDKKITTP